MSISHSSSSARTGYADADADGDGDASTAASESPLGRADCFSILTVSWLAPLLARSHQRKITQGDIPKLPPADRTPHITQMFLTRWRERLRARAESRNSSTGFDVLRACVGPKNFILAGTAALASNIATLLQPYCIQRVIGVLIDTDRTLGEGFIWSAALVACTFLASLMLNLNAFAAIRAGNAARSALMQAIYEKALTLTKAARQQQSSGTAINILAADTQRIFDAAQLFHPLWLAPTIIIVALILMVSEVGWAAVAGVALLSLLSPFQIWLSNRTSAYRAEMLQYSDQRVKLMSEILGGIRIVKLYAWEAALAIKIEQIRAKELRQMVKLLYLSALNQTLLFVTPALTAAVVMCTSAFLGNTVTAESTFSILAYLNIIRSPIIFLPLCISAMAEAKVSAKRIHDFLVLEERWPPVRQAFDASLPYSISVERAHFIWSPDQTTPTLADITLHLRPGALVAVIGGVGAGKSSLLSAMLGEMRQVAGIGSTEQILPTSELAPQINGHIAYVNQEAWIFNDTVRNNILFGLEFDQSQYDRVLDAACLRHDLTTFSDGDRTMIGERGLNMSGGQKSRLSLARALYRNTQSSIYLLDDTFAALDLNVGATIFQTAIKGLLKGKTIVMCMSSHLHLLPQFDRIIVLESVEVAADNTTTDANANGARWSATTNGNHAQSHTSAAFTASASTTASARTCRILAAGTYQELQGEGQFPSLLSQLSKAAEADDESEEDAEGEVVGDEAAAIDVRMVPFDESHAPVDEIDLLSPMVATSCMSIDFPEAMLLNAATMGGEAFHSTATGRKQSIATAGVQLERKLSLAHRPPLKQQSSRSLLQLSESQSGVASSTKRPSTKRLHPTRGSARGSGLLSTAITEDGRRMSVSRRRAESVAVEAAQIAAAKSAELLKSAPPCGLKPETTEDEDKQGAVSLKVWLIYFAGGNQRRYGLTPLLIMTLLFITSQVLRIACDSWLSLWSGQRDFAGHSNTWWTIIYASIIAATFILALARSLGFARYVAVRSSRSLHDRALRFLSHASVPRFFDITPMGQVLNLFSKDLDTLDMQLPMTLLQCLGNLFILLGVVGITIASTPYMSPLFLPIGILIWLVQRYFRPTNRALKRLEHASRSPIFSRFSETLAGLAVIRAYGVEQQLVAKNAALVEENSATFALLWWSQRWLALRLDWVSLLVVVTVSFLMVGLRSSITVEVASLALVYSLQFTSLLQLTARNVVDVESYLTSVERLQAFKRVAKEKPRLVAAAQPPSSWPAEGAIEFRDVTMRYRPDLPLILKGLTVSIRPREKVGICGRTGSGKSSTMLALFRIIECDSGSILIDGVDIGRIGLETLRSALSIIPQEPILFSETMRYNLDPFNQCSDRTIHEVLRRVHLSALVATFPLGLQEHITDGGENLSSGQRQLVCCARALLRQSKVILLDEASSALDPDTDALLQETIRVNFADATVLSIAHRLETIIDSDRILVLDDGRLAEFASPIDLLTREDSILTQLVRQGGGEPNRERMMQIARQSDDRRREKHDASKEAIIGAATSSTSPIGFTGDVTTHSNGSPTDSGFVPAVELQTTHYHTLKE